MIITLLIGSVAAADTTSNTTTFNKQTSSISSTTTPEVQKTQATTHKSIENSSQATQNTQIKTENTKVQTVTNANKVTTNNKVENTSITKTNKSLKSSSAKTATKTSVTSIRGNKGAKITIKATVTTNNDLKVVSGKTAFKINGKTIGQSTVKNGVTTLPYTIPTSWADETYKITVVYGGNNQYASSTGTGTLGLDKTVPTKTQVTPIKGKPGQKINIQATVTTQKGAKVTSGKTAFKINGKTIGQSTVKNGVTTLPYTIPTSWKDTTYTITVVYGGYNQYISSTSTGKLTLEKSTSTKVLVTSINGVAGQKINIQATVTTQNGVKVTSGKTAFKINGKTIGQSTVKNGVTTLPYTIPTSWKDTTYTITVVYGGNSQYLSSQSTGKLTLKNTPTKVQVSPITADRGDKVTIQATVTTQNGVKVTSGKVAFKINGKTIGYGTVANGVAKLSYTIPNWTYKTYTITAVYGGYNQYKSSEGTSTLKVVKKSDIPAGFEAYLKATKNCEVTNSKIKNLAAKFNSYTSTLTKAKAIFNQLNKITSYSGYYNTRYGAVGTLNRGYGNCVDMAHLLNAVARASGIPARYCHATCYFRSGLVTGHVWSELYVDGKWYKCDLTSNSNSFGSIVNWNSCGSITRYISLPF